MIDLVAPFRYRRVLKDLPPPPATVLDVGGGYGKFADTLRYLGYHVTVGDIKNGDFYLDAGEKFPFEDDAFDIVTCLAVVEHVDDWSSLLHECQRVGVVSFVTSPSPIAHPVLVALSLVGIVRKDHLLEHSQYLTRESFRRYGFRHSYFQLYMNQIGVS